MGHTDRPNRKLSLCRLGLLDVVGRSGGGHVSGSTVINWSSGIFSRWSRKTMSVNSIIVLARLVVSDRYLT